MEIWSTGGLGARCRYLTGKYGSLELRRLDVVVVTWRYGGFGVGRPEGMKVWRSAAGGATRRYRCMEL